MPAGITIWHKLLVWWVLLNLMFWGLKMKHFWTLHGTKQINFKYDITRLREKAMMKETKRAHLPCPRWQWKLFKWITSSLLFPSAIFQHRHTPMCLLISKHGDHLFQRVWKRKRELLRMKEYLPTYLVKIAFSAYKVKVKSLSPVQLCDPMDCSLSGSSIHGILQARVLEWTAISFSRGSSQPRNRTRVSRIAGRLFTVWATREVFIKWKHH